VIRLNYKKIDIAKKISNKTGYPLSFTKKIVSYLTESLIDCIKNDSLIIKNIGSFTIIQKKERIGRNPKTNENFIITQRKSISFHPSKNILKKLNASE
tara:strand:+ start:846 stop:1139 length:294 start_codon:yes stop_codon:yes gene_type:complete